MVSHREIRLLIFWIFLLTLATLVHADTVVTRTTPTCSYEFITPTPSGVICGAEGHALNHPSPISTSSTDYVSCENSCLDNRRSCLSFSYGPGWKCITYKTNIIKSKFKKSDTNRFYWNDRCFNKTCGLCPPGLTKCNDRLCSDLYLDAKNCGQCGFKCQPGALCDRGTCKCRTYRRLCSGACVDVRSDVNNCGGCGKACGTHSTCENRTCICQIPQSIQNGGFEIGSLGPWNSKTDSLTQITVPDDSEGAYKGRYYVDIRTAPPGGKFNFTLSQPLTVCSKRGYNVSFHVKSAYYQVGSGDDCNLNICVNGNCAIWRSVNESNPPTSWSMAQFIAESSPSGLDSTITVNTNDTSSCSRQYIHLDQFSMVPNDYYYY